MGKIDFSLLLARNVKYKKALTGVIFFFTMGVKNDCLDFSRKIFGKKNKLLKLVGTHPLFDMKNPGLAQNQRLLRAHQKCLARFFTKTTVKHSPDYLFFLQWGLRTFASIIHEKYLKK